MNAAGQQNANPNPYPSTADKVDMPQNANPNPYPSTVECPTHYTYNFNYMYYLPAGVDPQSELFQGQSHPLPGIGLGYVPQPVAVQSAQHPQSSEQLLGYEPQQVTPFAVGLSTNPKPKAQSEGKEKGSTANQAVQSVRCEVCKIDCTSNSNLNQHRLGKNHRKNLEKVKEKDPGLPLPTPNPVVRSPPLPVYTSAPLDKPHVGPHLNPNPTNGPIIGPEENPEKPKLSNSQKARKRKARSCIDDLETKRRRALGDGAAAEAIQECGLCNVICTSDKVLASHLASKKHALMLKAESRAKAAM